MVNHTCIKIILFIMAHMEMELEQIDVKIAFLHGQLEKTIHKMQS